jgi:hypothetical protein
MGGAAPALYAWAPRGFLGLARATRQKRRPNAKNHQKFRLI